MGDELPVGPYRYGLPGTHRQGGPPTGKNGDIGGTEKTLASDPFQGSRVAVEAAQQAASAVEQIAGAQKMAFLLLLLQFPDWRPLARRRNPRIIHDPYRRSPS